MNEVPRCEQGQPPAEFAAALDELDELIAADRTAALDQVAEINGSITDEQFQRQTGFDLSQWKRDLAGGSEG